MPGAPSPFLAALSIAAALSGPAPAGACNLALLLAIDISGSVDDREYKLQVQGTADALSDPEIAHALIQGKVAVAVVQWSAVGMQKVVQPWKRMDSRADVAAFAAAARAQDRVFGKADTAVADAIAFAVRQFDEVPDCRFRILDISGDGVQNAGGPLPDARDRAIAAGIGINAIAIEGMGVTISEFYRRAVITKGGFVVTARGHEDYPRAIRAKLLREIAVPLG
jgi:Ca-activated chloride channel homolog